MQNGSGLKLSCSAPLHLYGGPNKSPFRGPLYSSWMTLENQKYEQSDHLQIMVSLPLLLYVLLILSHGSHSINIH